MCAAPSRRLSCGLPLGWIAGPYCSDYQEAELGAVDTSIIVAYFVAMLGLGCWYQRRAADSLGSYFLGDQRIPWLALAMSGSVSNFDITGTMWIVALISLFGMKSMWNHWMWGFLMGAFFLSYMGKWIRRSNVMTGAEWMLTRFGEGKEGVAARSRLRLNGGGHDGWICRLRISGDRQIRRRSTSTPTHGVCAIAIFAITTTYVMLGGLYSVVITDVIQTVILTMAAILIMFVAYSQLTPAAIAAKLPSDWASLTPPWRLDAEMARTLPSDYGVYECFGALVIVWVMKGLLLNLGGPAQMYDFQRFLAARNPRDAAKVGAAWSLFLIVRWGMATGIALLAIVGIGNVTDPEQVMPVVLQEYLPVGVRGLVIAGLLAAFMSTFSSTVNGGASYIIRDLWQPLVRPDAGDRELIRASYVATLAIVVVGTLIGVNSGSIRSVFDWIMGALGAAFVIPNVLRWYWWRLNGLGYAIGTVAGLAMSLAVPFFDELAPLYVSFPLICTVSLIATLAGTWLTRPTNERVLIAFYENVRPFGFWAPIQRASSVPVRQLRGEGIGLAVFNVLTSMVAIFCAYVAPMYLVSHYHGPAILCAVLAVAAAVVLKFSWYDQLPKAEDALVSKSG